MQQLPREACIAATRPTGSASLGGRREAAGPSPSHSLPPKSPCPAKAPPGPGQDTQAIRSAGGTAAARQQGLAQAPTWQGLLHQAPRAGRPHPARDAPASRQPGQATIASKWGWRCARIKRSRPVGPGQHAPRAPRSRSGAPGQECPSQRQVARQRHFIFHPLHTTIHTVLGIGIWQSLRAGNRTRSFGTGQAPGPPGRGFH